MFNGGDFMSDLAMLIFGFGFIFAMTTLGSSIVYFLKKDISTKANTIILGFASGIMIAASIWSLLIPALEDVEDYGKLYWLPAAVGFLLGGGFLVLMDKLVPHFHKGTNLEEGPQSSLKKSTKLFLAVLIHNIPEGLAVGFAFGAAANIGTHAAYIAALGLAIGLGIQNFPEGAAVALPMRAATNSSHKAFLYGMGTGVVEPIFAIVGYFLATQIHALQPWLLAFSAGAMIFVVVEDLIPDCHLDHHPHLGTWALMIGFVLMMVLDVALG